MDKKITAFIKRNEDLIQGKRWEKIYKKDFPIGFTETLLDCGVNPLEQGLNYIPDHFLHACRNIKEFTIPSSIISIGKGAFQNCSSLTSIEIPDSVINIDWHAFYACISLTSVKIPDSIKSIGMYAFSDCWSLTNIEIPDSVTSIGSYAFAHCTSLTKLNYKGTKEEAIELGIGNKSKKNWREGSAIEKIICTDGEIEL